MAKCFETCLKHGTVISFLVSLSTLLFSVSSEACTAIVTLTAGYCRLWRRLEGSVGRLRLKCDGTRAETRFRPSAKWTSPFKSAGASVQSTTCSRGLRISGSNAGYTMFRGSDGTRRRTGGEVKGKLANGVGSQYSSHYLGTWCIQH